MSPFRREAVYASIALDRAALVRLGADGTAKEQLAVALTLDREAPERSLDTLAATLAASAWRGVPRTVVLSDRLVRYLVVDRPQGIRSAAELRLACEARFQAAFDRPAQEWQINIDARPFARRFLACGMEKSLHDALVACLAVDGALLSLKPYLVSELARRASSLHSPCWLAVAAHDSVTLAGVADDECSVVRVLATEAPVSIADIERALDRERLLAGDVPQDAAVVVTGAVSGDFGATAVRRLDATTWGSHTALWAQTYRMALSQRWA